VEFSGRVVFTGMRKSEFVSLFGSTECKDRDDDCLTITHLARTPSGEIMHLPDGAPASIEDGFAIFDKSGRVDLIERNWDSATDIDSFWKTLFNLISGGVAAGGSTVSILPVANAPDGRQYLLLRFKNGQRVELQYLTGMTSGDRKDLSAVLISEYFR
jgi:hypothetical protein